MTRILVTGSRTWTAAAEIRRVLDETLAEFGPFTLVHGACPRGADAIADAWAAHHNGDHNDVTVERWPARWAEHGRKAGFYRNMAMVESGVDRVLAFHAGNSAGTAQCMAYARSRGVPVVSYTSDKERSPR